MPRLRARACCLGCGGEAAGRADVATAWALCPLVFISCVSSLLSSVSFARFSIWPSFCGLTPHPAASSTFISFCRCAPCRPKVACPHRPGRGLCCVLGPQRGRASLPGDDAPPLPPTEDSPTMAPRPSASLSPSLFRTLIYVCSFGGSSPQRRGLRLTYRCLAAFSSIVTTVARVIGTCSVPQRACMRGCGR